MEKRLNTTLFHRGKHFDFLQDEVELRNGHRTTRDIVRHPGAVAIVPLLPDGKVILVRQYRYAAGKTLLEIPAGTLEPEEPPLLCAHRELREETGYEAEEITPLLSCFMAPGYSSEVIHFYLAKRLKHIGDVQDADEDISLEICGLEDVKKMIKDNEIEDAKTIIGIKILDS